MKLIDLSGRRFDRLSVLGRCGTAGGKPLWACVCECGEFAAARADHMMTGRSRSCGCLRRDTAGAHGITHGMSKTRTYRIWRDMRNRCHYEKYPERHLYGGRGIEVCAKWRESFAAFVNDMGEAPDDKSIAALTGHRPKE